MIRVCELFAGVGGFRLGLEKSWNDYKFVWAYEWEPGEKTQHAYDCYVSHFGKENHIWWRKSSACITLWFWFWKQK